MEGFGVQRFGVQRLGRWMVLGGVAGLLVAIPSMFGYNYLVHSLRVLTVELDNFAQELAARMEIEFLQDEDVRERREA